MLDALLSLIPGGSLTAIGAGIVAALVALWRFWAKASASGAAKERAKRDRDRLEAIDEAREIDDAIAGRDPDINRQKLGRWSPWGKQ